MNSVIRFFRSWPVARDMAGIAFDTMPDSVRGRHLKGVFRPTARAQTADEAITAIRERSGGGHSLLGKRVIAEDKRLYNDAFHFFGSWVKAVEAAGLADLHAGQVRVARSRNAVP
jgi:hypothetical protein